MKQIKSILICGLVLAVTGVTTLVVAAGGERNTKAIVRSMHGKVTYKAAGGDWMPLRVNQELGPGVELKSEAGAEAYLQVNGLASTVKLTESTDITLAKMLQMGPMFSPDSSTDLKLDGGTVLGSVRKLSANSDYKVTVPNGVAGIRGTDFQVTVTVTAQGGLTITFTSVTGTVFCQVTVAPGTAGLASQTLTTGQSWTVTGTMAGGITTLNSPVLMPAVALGAIIVAVEDLNNVVATQIAITSNPTGTGTTTTTITTHDTGSSETGGSSTTTTTTTGTGD